MNYFVGFMLTLIILLGIAPLGAGIVLLARHRAETANTPAAPRPWGTYGLVVGGAVFTLALTAVTFWV
ncbi:MAG: hypothetical protein FWB76_02990 [Oscillospiraceae bacterium]|nr:hypothetical protein [Oscillospiraceae bacterium]